MQGPASFVVLQAQQIIISTNGVPGNGLFVYNPSPGLGNLTASIVAVAGTDDYSNATEAGITQYVVIAGHRWAVNLGVSQSSFGGFSVAALTFTDLTNPPNSTPFAGGGRASTGQSLVLSSGQQNAGVNRASFFALEDQDDASVTGGKSVFAAGQHEFQVLAAGAYVDALVVEAIGAVPVAVISGEILLIDQASTPAAQSGAASVFADTAGYGRTQPDSSTGDSNTYSFGRALFAAAGQNVNSLTTAPVNGISGIHLSANRYHVSGMISLTQGTVTATQQLAIVFNNASTATIGVKMIEGTTVEASATWTTGSPNLQFSWPANSTGELWFDGVVVQSAAGTIGLAVSCVTAAADTFRVVQNSHMIIERI